MALVPLPAEGVTEWYDWASQTDMFARTPQANPLREVGTDKLAMAKGEYVSVGHQTETTMLDVTGPGCVKSLWMAIGGGPGASLDGRIRVYYDGATMPDFDIDIGSLWAAHFDVDQGQGSKSAQHMHVETAGPGGNYNNGVLMTFPMPFGTSIKVTYYNPSTTYTASLFFMLTYSLYDTDRANGLRLRCQGARYADQAVAVTATQTYDFATITGGPGAVIWHSYVGGVNATDMTWLERNMMLYIDGESTASIQSSGTEDWFDSAWYYNGWAGFDTSIHSYVGADKPSGNAYVVGQATDLLSKWGGVPFTSSCTFQLGTESDCTTGHTFAYAILYYSVS